MPLSASGGGDDLDALDIPTVCRRSKTGRSFVYGEIRAGRLIARKLGRLTRILRADFEAWLAAAPPISPLPRASTTGGPRPAPVLSSVPSNVGDALPAKLTDRAGVGQNGGPPLELTEGSRQRRARSGARR